MTQLKEVSAYLEAMLQQLQQRLASVDKEDILMIGIHTGGVWIAKELHCRLSLSNPLGSLNISFYRDDFTRIGMHPQVNPSDLPVSVEDKVIVLVDDVLFTGRTIRAALNEIFDYGRPAQVILATLIDRGGRELPIQADIVGDTIELGEGQQVKLTGPEPLALSLITA